jgi:hypothetical protein
MIRCDCIDADRHGHLETCEFWELEMLRAQNETLTARLAKVLQANTEVNAQCMKEAVRADDAEARLADAERDAARYRWLKTERGAGAYEWWVGLPDDEQDAFIDERITVSASVTPDEADDLLRLIGLDPERYRTECGFLNMPKVRAALKYPDQYPWLADAERYRWLQERVTSTGLAHWMGPYQTLSEAVDAARAASVRRPCPICRGAPCTVLCSFCEGRGYTVHPTAIASEKRDETSAQLAEAQRLLHNAHEKAIDSSIRLCIAYGGPFPEGTK